jgi:hypothetical protein
MAPGVSPRGVHHRPPAAAAPPPHRHRFLQVAAALNFMWLLDVRGQVWRCDGTGYN